MRLKALMVCRVLDLSQLFEVALSDLAFHG
jgi:hypothetical protein